jgi:hypothetical protein
LVTTAWTIIITAMRYHYAELKWSAIYSKTTNPREWDRLANDAVDHPFPAPFGLSKDGLADLEQKVKAITSHPIEPI